jgi:thiol:disulfide interchange protein DsbG
VQQGKVQMRWIMVGFLKPSSAGRAAAVMAAKDGAKAMTQDQTAFNAATEEGGLAELKPIPPALQAALTQHTALMETLQFQGTPALLFKDKSGHWQGLPGMPTLAQLGAAMGLVQ